MTTRTRNAHIADICLYGNTKGAGAGWIVALRDTRVTLGNGELNKDRNLTSAVWQAQEAIRDYHTEGRIRVLSPTGTKLAWIDAAKTAPYYGDLTWEDVEDGRRLPTVTIEAAARTCPVCGDPKRPQDDTCRWESCENEHQG